MSCYYSAAKRSLGDTRLRVRPGSKLGLNYSFEKLLPYFIHVKDANLGIYNSWGNLELLQSLVDHFRRLSNAMSLTESVFLKVLKQF